MISELRNKKQKNILWIDLEMTGLDPVADRILEVGAIITDWDFNEIATYEAAISVDQKIVEQRMYKGPSAPFWESVPEVRDALIAQNSSDSARPGKEIEDELLALISTHFEDEIPVVLAGNSIHMDRQFIQQEWKKLDARLHYRMLDVSAWKLVFEHKFKKKFAKREAHRALDDIRGSIQELQYYMKKVKK